MTFIPHKGPKYADINTAFQQAIQRVDEGKESARRGVELRSSPTSTRLG